MKAARTQEKIKRILQERGAKTSSELIKFLKDIENVSPETTRVILSTMKKQEIIECIPTQGETGLFVSLFFLPDQLYEAVEKALFIPYDKIDEFQTYQREKYKEIDSQVVETRAIDWLRMAFISLENTGLSKRDRLEFVKGLSYYYKDPNLSPETEVYILLKEFMDNFLRDLANNSMNLESEIKSLLLFNLKDFTREHFLKSNQRNKVIFFNEKIDVPFPEDGTLLMTRYELVKKIYAENQNNKVGEGTFSILNEIYFNSNKIKLDASLKEELKAIIENVFFSVNSNENLVQLVERGWENWLNKEEKFAFWKKVNEQLSNEDNNELKKRFRNFIMKITDKAMKKKYKIYKRGETVNDTAMF